jgi:DNA-binding response OmpR family regulator
VAATSPGLRDAGLIIVDIGVAKAAGLKTISALREASAVPILTISALGGEGMARDCASVGSDDFLAKPFPIGVLVGKVARHLAAVGAADPA